MKFNGLALGGAVFLALEIFVINTCSTNSFDKNTTKSVKAVTASTVSKATKVNSDSVAKAYNFKLPKATLPTPARATTPVVGPQIYNLPGYNYPGISNLYTVPNMMQITKDDNSVKEVKITDKKLKLSYSQNYGGNETKFEFELNNPSKEERTELYKVFIQQAREAQAAVKENYKIIQNEGGNTIVSNYNSR